MLITSRAILTLYGFIGADQLTESEGMTKQRKERYMWAAIGLAQTCAGVYEDSQTGK